MDAALLAETFRSQIIAVKTEIAKEVVGQDETVLGALIGLAVGGNILLEGAPGLGKTLLVRTLAQVVGLSFSRIQFTPDLMPADVTGTNVLAGGGGDGRSNFTFRKGPIFANIVLADEINRATPKTQSSLLEAMQERAITADGVRYQLDEPFMVLATQNPIEHEGTYVLPEAQLDRFLLKLIVPPPSLTDLASIVDRTTGRGSNTLNQAITKDEILTLQRTVRDVPIAPSVRDYGLRLVVGSHPGNKYAPTTVNRYVRYGASPRAAQAIILTAKVFALMAGRFNVSKGDIERAALPALRHRILLNYEAEANGVTQEAIVETLVSHAETLDRDPITV